MSQSRKAWMKAVREVCGISQKEIAEMASVTIYSVKRWEKPDFNEPPDDVIEWLKDAVEEHDRAVNEIIKDVSEKIPKGETVMLEWYRNQEQLDYVNVEAITRVGFVNAVTRSAAELLGHLGYKVMFKYPDQEVVAKEIKG